MTDKIRLSDSAEVILAKRYYKKDNQGNVIEAWPDVAHRVGNALAEPERKYCKKSEADDVVAKVAALFTTAIADRDFLPNTPCIMNAGKVDEHGKPSGQMAACFVIGIEDSMPSIMKAATDTALIHQSGGGTGFSFSTLRPEGEMVKSTHGVASGPVSFMRIFDTITDVVKQGGARRGANMGILRVDHPDIFRFMSCKSEGKKFENFNLSVAMTDEFMAAVEVDGDFDLRYNGKIYQTVKARAIWEKIIEGAWKYGENGAFFIDTAERSNPVPHIGKIVATNPCGEVPMQNYNSCCLASINLTNMLCKDNNEYRVDEEKLRRTVRLAVRFLDNLVDANAYPISEIEEVTRANRQLGLGIMGWADMLIKFGVRYDSQEAIDMAANLMQAIKFYALETSRDLAMERGVYSNLPKGKDKIRNSTLTCIAPTGTISIFADCSSGIEPVFGYVVRANRVDTALYDTARVVLEWCAENGVEPLDPGIKPGMTDKEIGERLAAVNAKYKEILPDCFVTFDAVAPEWHVKMLSTFQTNGVDLAVSKTVNLPYEATKEDIEKIYMMAWKSGCKGLTVYRDGSKESQVLTAGGAPKALTEKKEQSRANACDLDVVYGGCRVLINNSRTKKKAGYLWITSPEGIPQEIFHKAAEELKPEESALIDLICRLVSKGLQGEMDIVEYANQIKKALRANGATMQMPMATYIERALRQGAEAIAKQNGHLVHSDICPDCGQPIRYEQGCVSCGCGSKCG